VAAIKSQVTAKRKAVGSSTAKKKGRYQKMQRDIETALKNAKHIEVPDSTFDRVENVLRSLDGKKDSASMKPRYRKPAFIAAVIVVSMLMLSTFAIAANVFGIRDLFSPVTVPAITFDNFPGTEEEYREIQPDGTLDDITVDLISLQGFAGSPEHAAAIELRNSVFPDPYNSVNTAIATTQEDFDELTRQFGDSHQIILVEYLDEIPMVYRGYGAYTWEKIEQVNEIAEKYGLILIGDFVMFDWSDASQWEVFQNEIAYGPFLDDSLIAQPGSLWDSGTFLFDIRYEDDINIQVFSSRKGVLDGRLFPVDDITDYSHKYYENVFGSQLLLMQNKFHSFIIIDTETAFVVVSIHAGSETLMDENTYAPYTIDLEHFANLIDFTLLK